MPIYKWKKVDKEKTELIGSYECEQCGGHIMLDATFLEQVDTKLQCPYCSVPIVYSEEE